MKRYFVLVGLFVTLMYSCNNKPSQQALEKQRQDNIEAVEREAAEKAKRQAEEEARRQAEEEERKANSIVGIYEITEESYPYRTVVLTVNADETASMRYKNIEYIEYGSWYKYSTMKYTQFKFRGTTMNLEFSTLNVCKLGSFVLMDEYMYSSSDAADAKDPRERLKLKRISAE